MAKRTEGIVTSLYAVGDVGPDREEPESIFSPTVSFLKESDILFCQLERTLSEEGSYQLGSGSKHSRVNPRNVRALTYIGVDVASFASNHCLDYGYEAFFDTIDLLKKSNISVVGVGKNLAEARQPVIIDRKGARVAFLAYNSILPPGYAAEHERPGCAPIRIKTFYEQMDWQPGTPPRILTIPDRDDVEAMEEDIKKVRPLADVVVVSLHWGIHHIPGLIAMYQREVGHAAIDAGADLILGHHAHILKGIEVYKGKVIFFSLCNFGFERAIKTLRRTTSHLLYGQEPDPEYPTYPWPVDTRKTILVKCLISGKGLQKVSFLPAMVNKQAQPEILPREDNRSLEVLRYVESLSKDFGTKFSFEGDEVIVQTS